MIPLYRKVEKGNGLVEYVEMDVKSVNDDIQIAPIRNDGVLLIIGGVRHGIPLAIIEPAIKALQKTVDEVKRAPRPT